MCSGSVPICPRNTGLCAGGTTATLCCRGADRAGCHGGMLWENVPGNSCVKTIGEPPTMGMPHPPAPQEPPDRAVPGRSGSTARASAPRANSASLRMAGSLLIRAPSKNPGSGRARASLRVLVCSGLIPRGLRSARPIEMLHPVGAGDISKDPNAKKGQNDNSGGMHNLQGIKAEITTNAITKTRKRKAEHKHFSFFVFS